MPDLQNQSVDIQQQKGVDFQQVAGGAGLIGGAVQAISSPFLQKWSQDYARHEAGQAWERSMESWRQQNEYNNPTNQLKRIKEAGLNPNLIYGNFSMNQAAKGAPSSPTAAQVPFRWETEFPALDILGKYQDLRIKKADADAREMINRGKRADADVKIRTMEALVSTAWENAKTSEQKAAIAKINTALAAIKQEYASEGVMPGIDLATGRIVAGTDPGIKRDVLLDVLAGLNQVQKSTKIGFGAGFLKQKPALKNYSNSQPRFNPRFKSF